MRRGKDLGRRGGGGGLRGLQDGPPKVSREKHTIKLPVLGEAMYAEGRDPVGQRLSMTGVLTAPSGW